MLHAVQHVSAACKSDGNLVHVLLLARALDCTQCWWQPSAPSKRGARRNSSRVGTGETAASISLANARLQGAALSDPWTTGEEE